MTRILFVCLGNICRSPLAEGIMRDRLERDGAGLVLELDSAGTGGWHAGQGPDPRAVAVASARGVDISRQRARQVRPEDFHHFDLILCADRSNHVELLRQRPADARARVEVLLDHVGLGGEVPDPYQGGPRHFESVYDLLEQAADRLLARLRSEAQSRLGHPGLDPAEKP